MKQVKEIVVTIDGKQITTQEGKTVLEVAREAGINIPTLCHHPALEDVGACRLCLIEVEGRRGLSASCVFPVFDGMVVRTNTPEIRSARKTVLELLIARHPQECLTCPRNNNCELQSLAYQYGINDLRFRSKVKSDEKDYSSEALLRDPAKCIVCGRCVRMCNMVQSVSALGFSRRGLATTVGPAFEKGLDNSPCVSCGQCSLVCPVAAIEEQDHIKRVEAALADPSKHVVVQVAPAVRAALGEEFGLPPGTSVTGKMAAALRRLGFDKVFDTQFTADLTILEEGTEFLQRLQTNGKLPLITSCSPGWINFCETFYPEFMDNLSTCKSPQQMFGAMVKTYYPEKSGIDPATIYSVSIMPCTAKKFEATRSGMDASGYTDVDAVLTTRELARLIRSAGIDFNSLPDEDFDTPMGLSTGAATLFGVTGGVMEAALRTVYEKLTGETLKQIEFCQVRGIRGVREAVIDIKGLEVRVAVASGLANAVSLLERIRSGEAMYHFIEIMACPGGCIGGGGQPRSMDPDINRKRAMAVYTEDESMTIRKSHENPAIIEAYNTFLGEPGSHKAHELLHTTYKAQKEGMGILPKRDKSAS